MRKVVFLFGIMFSLTAIAADSSELNSSLVKTFNQEQPSLDASAMLIYGGQDVSHKLLADANDIPLEGLNKHLA